jgi:RNA polymerase sigma factor (sigma-70 family)
VPRNYNSVRTSRPDDELVAATLRGDRSAFAVLLDRHAVGVRALAGRLLPSHDAEDVAQEALLQAFLGLGRLRDPARFGPWLYGITLNLAKMRLRSRAAARLRFGGTEEQPASGPSPQQALEAREFAELVRDALEVLPQHEREAVLLHYGDGLTPSEMAAALGERPGTVRVRLHRARRRLHERLLELAPQIRPDTKEDEMIEVTVDDVVVRLAEEEGNGQPVVGPMRIVLLKERDGERVLPIWVGAPEGDALALQLGGEAMPRPLTADLMARLLDAAGARVERVVVNKLQDNTFYATVAVESGGKTEEIDARPSDALNLATRIGAPIYVADEIMAKAVTDDLEALLTAEEASLGLEPSPSGEWRSLSPAVVKALHPPPQKRE